MVWAKRLSTSGGPRRRICLNSGMGESSVVYVCMYVCMYVTECECLRECVCVNSKFYHPPIATAITDPISDQAHPLLAVSPYLPTSLPPSLSLSPSVHIYLPNLIN